MSQPIIMYLLKKSGLLITHLLLAVLFFLGGEADAQSNKKEEWKVRKNENGITVYSRHTTDAEIDELKIVSVMHASLSSITAVIMDADHYPEWIYACDASKILKQVSAIEQYQYQVINVPAPFTDRDAVIHFSISQDPNTKVVITKSEAAPQYIPSNKGLVRLPEFNASYQLIPQANGNVQIVYHLRINPGGYIPDWLVNWTIVTGPYQTTLNMQKQVIKPQYAQARLNFIQEP